MTTVDEAVHSLWATPVDVWMPVGDAPKPFRVGDVLGYPERCRPDGRAA